ncbi:MAG: alkaline phosphatase family protein [Gemmataceae bacterium]|nr:alkaline phosphatase family protein [Gemmataceae bacterium]MDW8243923.1 alkaline phosphatase family protein [Thermogemmata sp.]
MRTRAVTAMAGLLTLSLLLFVWVWGASGRAERMATAPQEPPGATPPVRLAVLLVFDQLRGDFLERWADLFGPDGFRRLQQQGAWFVNCHYPYGVTTTGPGHASIMTGTCPDRHGIVNNNWYEAGEEVYCASSPRYRTVPPATDKDDGGDESAPPGKPRVPTAGTPERLLTETVADVLRRVHPQARIYGLSLKDRSAILPVGQRPDGAFWFSQRFITSTYYAERLPEWLDAFQRRGVADRWFGKSWERDRPELDYVRWSGPDDQQGEGIGVRVTASKDPARGWSQGRVFPHPMNPPQRTRPGREYYEALANSPFGNDLLLELTKACVLAEKLGSDDVPDLLVVSFSSNDLVGHTWGPDSQEVLDITLRSDRVLAELLHFLDQQVGTGKYIVALTADHGICPLPEVSRQRHIFAQRVDVRRLVQLAEEHLSRVYGSPPAQVVSAVGPRKTVWFEAVSLPWLYLNPKVLAAMGRTRTEVAQEVADFLARQPEIYRVFTRKELEDPAPKEDPVAQRMARSYHPQRCGDLAVVLKPYCLPGSSSSVTPATGTTHGAPFSYDTHVPLLVYGPGIPGGVRHEAVTPQATAAIFAQWLGIPRPRHAEYPVPQTLLSPAARK